MELFELVLLLLACVAVSSVLDQMISRMSLPLLQIAVGFLAAIALPRLAEVHIDAELFLLLFIAPLLFREAQESEKLQLWRNKWSILSMAIALVIVSVLVAGFILHWIIPSIPLAAAFACAAALGPTDAAAVAALGQTISLTKRQSVLLSGEALINDASGVVSFQFAIAAAVTGAFSVTGAVGSFSVLFFGGIAAGIIMGFILRMIMTRLRRLGYVNTIIHVMYEVLTPFLLFIAAEEIHVSGILAVVAAGIVMQEKVFRLNSPERARQELVSNSFWEVIIFLINGVIFVMLGMQLPKVMNPDAMGGTPPAVVIGAMLAVTAAVVLMRFLWLSAQELIHKDPDSGLRGMAHPGRTIRNALVTTIAGPKGAVTLSIIMTIPLFVGAGNAFPQRETIIFITSGVILCTLLLADLLLPRLAPKAEDADETMRLEKARTLVLEATVDEMRAVLDEYPDAEFTPAMRLALVRYRVRLMRHRLSMEHCGQVMEKMILEVLRVQQKRADEIQQQDHPEITVGQALPYFAELPGIRSSIGYFGGAENVGARFHSRKGRLLLRLARFKRRDYDDDQKARIYYDTVLFAIDLEHAAMDYLQTVKETDDPTRSRVASVLLEEHEAALESLWGRLNYGQDRRREDTRDLEHGIHEGMPQGIRNTTGEQFRKAWHFADEADANALQIELDQIRRLRAEGKISEHDTRTLREEVYLMQTSLME
ncbi:MAG: Na+/H+ antiporter [Firmicutes bacterium]|nr:Na+/H+ antiporter [Bacillota bacterium]